MSDELFSVQEQIVLVSGGTRGIGLAIAGGFAERGARVVLTGRTSAAAEKSAQQLAGGAECAPLGLGCDVTRAGDVEQLVAGVLERFGHVDTLVNVAGVNRRKPALDVSEDDYDFILDTNLKGAFLLSRELGKAMTARGRGSQINIASLNTDRPLKNVLPYAMSKAAMAHMTRGLAVEWGPAGVRVNAIAPGFILTDLTRKLWSDPTMQGWGLANTPQRRLGTPEDIVGAAIFLASPAAAFITGQILYVDGGFTSGWSWPIPQSGGQ
jgi:Dehydrogenases with different specificities (related to short-chain alcohol dehydrogenases)